MSSTVTMYIQLSGRSRGFLPLLSMRFSSIEAAARSRESERGVKPFSAIPGPKPLPVLRNLLELKRNLPRMHLYIEECYEKYGEIFKLETPGGKNNFVAMADPNHLESILRAEGKYPTRDSNFSPNIKWILTKLKYPTTFAVKTGKEWKDERSAANNQIKPRNVFSYTDGLSDVAARFTEYLRSARDENNRISDISTLLRRLLAELSAKFVYDIDLHALDNPTEESEQFIEAVTLLLDCIGRLVVEPPLYKVYPNKIARKYGSKQTEKVRQKIEAGEESEVQGLLEQWLREGKMSEELALMLSADMFSAGVDTTSNQAAFLLYCMAKNPEAQEELYQQIRSVLGDRTHPLSEDLSKIPHLKGCVMESFRLLQEDTTLMGYHIPAETTIWYLNGVAGKNDQLFPNPERFDPARWARDKPNPFAVLPFGFGPRSCYGKRFAELELKLILCQVTKSFVLGTEIENLEKEMLGTIKPAGDLPLFVKDRN